MFFQLKRMADAMVDRRMPYFLPLSLIRRYRLKRKIKNYDNLNHAYIALTFDIENVLGSYSVIFEKHSETSAGNFLSQLVNQYPKKGIKTTLFIQGNLVKENKKMLKELRDDGHSLVLHGYNHELWGRSKWFISVQPLSNDKKEDLLQASLKCFKESGLGRPTLFRAPNLIIDAFTLSLLKKHGFLIDSSSPSFEGVLPIPVFQEPDFIRIPVSADPIFEFNMKGLIIYCFHRLFDLKNIYNLNEEKLTSLIKNILSLQNSFGWPNHLVFLGHSWEFTDWNIKNKHLGYCSSRNLDLLTEKLSKIEKILDIEYVTMHELYNILKSSCGNSFENI